jgi:16S rRNA (adenine1518-N6/adenine1519-N6)-dimethyltransferase
VEKDRVLHEQLADTLRLQYPARLHLLEGDAVEHPLAGYSDGGMAPPDPGGPPAGKQATGDFKIVANLPYAISTPWMDAVLNGPLPSRMALMLQHEAAQRYAAQPSSKLFGAISIFLQAAYDLAPGHRVSAACFFPRPEVESYLLHLVRKPEPFVFSAAARRLLRACFQQRRKQLGALLRDRLPDDGAGWLADLQAAGYAGQSRPEEIPVALWRKLALRVQPPA